MSQSQVIVQLSPWQWFDPSQDDVLSPSLEPLVVEHHLLFLSVLTFTMELNLAGKRLWNEEEKVAKTIQMPKEILWYVKI